MKINKEHISKDSKTRIHQCEIPVVALTGGIGSGKSVVSKMLIEKGLPLIDADSLVHEIYEKQEVIDFIKNNYPTAYEDNKISFRKLREIFFQDKNIQEEIENLIYSHLPEQFNSHVNKKDSFVIYDVPLLFEKKLDKLVDLTLVVYCPEDTQLKRVMARDNNDEALVKKILAAQLPMEEKRVRADYAIDNSGPMEELENKVQGFLEFLLQGGFTQYSILKLRVFGAYRIGDSLFLKVSAKGGPGFMVSEEEALNLNPAQKEALLEQINCPECAVEIPGQDMNRYLPIIGSVKAEVQYRRLSIGYELEGASVGVDYPWRSNIAENRAFQFTKYNKYREDTFFFDFHFLNIKEIAKVHAFIEYRIVRQTHDVFAAYSSPSKGGWNYYGGNQGNQFDDNPVLRQTDRLNLFNIGLKFEIGN
jgi:dephospho-CoA kinase